MGDFEQQVTFLFVEDLARSLDFYMHKIGLELVIIQPSCRIVRVTGSSFLGLCERDVVSTNSVIVTFVPGDLDATYMRLEEAGVPCDGPPRYNELYDIEQFFAHDPDGYTLEFQRFCSSEWPA